MNNSAKFLKKQRRRAEQKLLVHVEKLGAAFCLETGLRASEVCLVSQREEDGSIVQYFQSRTQDNAISNLIAAAHAVVAANKYEALPGVTDLDEALAALQK